ncbi:hypothetical protein ACFQ2B_02225 [Streptomyces stramineus]
MYSGLPGHLGPDRPVYALQARALRDPAARRRASRPWPRTTPT